MELGHTLKFKVQMLVLLQKPKVGCRAQHEHQVYQTHLFFFPPQFYKRVNHHLKGSVWSSCQKKKLFLNILNSYFKICQLNGINKTMALNLNSKTLCNFHRVRLLLII